MFGQMSDSGTQGPAPQEYRRARFRRAWPSDLAVVFLTRSAPTPFIVERHSAPGVLSSFCLTHSGQLQLLRGFVPNVRARLFFNLRKRKKAKWEQLPS